MKEIFKKEVKTQQEEFPRRIFVEIGTNAIPIPFVGKKRFRAGDAYVGIDIDEENVSDARHNAERAVVGDSEVEAKNMVFTVGDAAHLPFPDKEVDEIYFGNVFGDPSILDGDKEKFLEEALRILKPDGQLIIKENNTPAYIEPLKLLLENHGFRIERIIKEKDSDWEREVMPYHRPGPQKSSYLFSYVLYARHSVPN